MAISTDEVHRVAKGLATTDGYSLSTTFRVGEGFEAPVWITYVTEARKLLRDQQALKHK